jgi:hypothetical protein
MQLCKDFPNMQTVHIMVLLWGFSPSI